MGPVSASTVAQSTEALNRILLTAQAKTLDQAEKLMKFTVETAVGKEPGKGAAMDCCG